MTAPSRFAAISGLLTGCLQAALSPASFSIPLRFEPNDGQAPPSVRYVSRAGQYTLEVEDRLMRLRPHAGPGSLEWRFEGARESSVQPDTAWPASLNYYIGSGAARGAQAWSALRYRSLYPGIDLVVHESSRSWEFDYAVSPGADPSRISLGIHGARHVHVDEAGDLVATTADGREYRWKRPRAWQGSDAVQAEYEVRGEHVRLKLGPWDRSRDLIIDPALSIVSYFGGMGNEMARGIAVANDGSIYTCGGTNSGDLPTSASSSQSNYRGADGSGTGDAFITKFSSTGHLLWTTYLGGSGDDSCTALALDSSGNVVVVGATNSGDFPVTSGVAQSSFGGSGGNNFYSSGDFFVAKFTPAGARVWATYLGGSSDDGASAVAVDATGDVYVAGFSMSTNFPGVSGGYQSTNHGSANEFINHNGYVTWWNTGDAVVAELDSTGQHVLHATYLGGSVDDGATSIALDAAGAGGVWIGGITRSSNFPTVTPLQGTFGGASSAPRQPVTKFGDGFLSKLDLALHNLLYSTYYGGSQDDGIFDIAVDGSGIVYATGFTMSDDFHTTAGASQTAFRGPNPLPSGRFVSLGDAFVLKLNPQTNQLVYSTLLGGSDDDAGTGIAIDSNGNAYICGSTKSSDFPLTSALQTTAGGFFGAQHFGDAFVAKYDPAGHRSYSSFFGGNNGEAALGIALDPTGGTAYITGITNSTNLPVTSGLQPAIAGEDTFLAAFAGLGSGPVTTTLSHVANGNGFDTLALLINTGTADAAYSMQFFNQSGQTVTYPLDPTEAGMTGTIPAGSEAIVRTTGTGSTTNLGWGQLTAPASVKGMLIYQQQASPTSFQEGSAPLTDPSQHFFVPFDNVGTVTSFGFVNPSSSATASVNFTVRYETGGTDTVPALTMSPRQQIAETVSTIWPGTSGKRGLVEVNSNTPIGMVAFRFQTGALTLLDTIAATAGGTTPITSTIAHTADGNNFRSTYLLTNSGTVAAPYTLTILGSTGQPETFGFDVANPLSGTVPAGSTLTIDTTGLGSSTLLGWAQLSAPPAVSGLEVFRQTVNGKEQQATVPISQTNLTHFFLPFDNVSDITSIALVNPSATATANMNVVLRFTDGTSSTGQLMLQPLNYKANIIASFLPATAGRAGVAEVTSDTPVGAIEVRFNPTLAFTSLRAVTP